MLNGISVYCRNASIWYSIFLIYVRVAFYIALDIHRPQTGFVLFYITISIKNVITKM